jgi:hypothetical protein
MYLLDIFTVDMDDGYGEALDHIGAVPGRTSVMDVGGVSYLVVEYNVYCASNGGVL